MIYVRGYLNREFSENMYSTPMSTFTVAETGQLEIGSMNFPVQLIHPYFVISLRFKPLSAHLK